MSENNQVERVARERAPRSKQKLKILYLAKILLENTDENHDITLQEIISKLDAYGVTSERKSLYDDIAQLGDFGYKIERKQYEKNSHYKIINRDFELAELKLLVDSVASAKFITEERSRELISKLESLTSRHNASKLQRQVHVAGRVKSMNEDILANVDVIHNAISENLQISFQYFQWNIQGKQELRKDGARYKISPWGLSWDDENYYMVGYDAEADMIKHYRVDKMLNIQKEIDHREGRDKFDELDMAAYTKKMFAMFDGEEEHVQLICKNDLAGVMVDRFGKDIHMLKVDDEHFKLTVKVAVSKHFLGWIFALGEGVRIVGPESVVKQMNDEIDRLIKQYR